MTDEADTLLFVVDSEVSDTTLGGVYASTTELLLRHILARDGLDDLRPGEEHVAGALAHDVEVRQCGRVDSTPSAGTEDSGDLRDDTRGQDIVLEDIPVAAQGVDPLLDTSTARVIQTDDRGTHAHGQLHDLTDLGSEHLREGTAEDREVLSEDVDQTTIDRTRARDDAVAEELRLVDTEVGRAVQDEGIDLVEAAFVQEHGDTLTCGELALLMLAVDSLLTATEVRLGTELDQLLDFL